MIKYFPAVKKGWEFPTPVGILMGTIIENQVVTLKDVDGIRVTDPFSQANIFAETIHRTFRRAS